MITRCKQLLRSSKPIVVVTALVAVLGVSGTAYSAKLITGRDVRDGSLTTADLSKAAKASLHGAKGARGVTGQAGPAGARGVEGAAGATGAAGAQGVIGGFGQTGAQGASGPQGLTGGTGAASTVAGPQGPIGPGGTTEGASCTVSLGRAGTIHWVDSGTGTEYSLHCVGVNL